MNNMTFTLFFFLFPTSMALSFFLFESVLGHYIERYQSVYDEPFNMYTPVGRER